MENIISAHTIDYGSLFDMLESFSFFIYGSLFDLFESFSFFIEYNYIIELNK